MFKTLKRGRAFYRSLLILAGPLVLQNLVSSSAGLVDTFMVGTLGQDELAGLSLANTPFFIGMLLIFGLQSGGSVLMSQYWGKRDKGAINRVLGVSWMFAIGFSFLFSAVIFFFPRQVMGLTTNNPVLLEVAVRYGRIVAFSNVLNAFVTIYTGARRSCESPLFGTCVVSIGVVSNVVMNYILIFGKLGFPAMGVEGAALATLLSRVVEVIITLLYIFFGDKKHRVLPIKLKLLVRPGKIIVRDFLKYSAPVMLNELFWSLGYSMYIVIYGHMAASSDIVAAYSLSGNIERIITVVMFAVANTSAVFVGKAIGAGQDKEDVFSLGRTFSTLSFIIGLVSGTVLLVVLYTIVIPFVFPAFSLSEGAQRACVIMTISMCVVLSFRSFCCTLIVGILRGGGDVKFGLYLDIGAMYLWAIPAAAVAGLVFKLDIMWVYLLVMSEEAIKATIGYRRFSTGKWIRNVTRELSA